VDQLARRLESTGDRLSDVERMNERAPRRSVAYHLDFFRRPSPAGEIVEYDIEAHARRRPIGGRVAQNVGEKCFIAIDRRSRSTIVLQIA
jgi:hypothetical protein